MSGATTTRPAPAQACRRASPRWAQEPRASTSIGNVSRAADLSPGDTANLSPSELEYQWDCLRDVPHEKSEMRCDLPVSCRSDSSIGVYSTRLDYACGVRFILAARLLTGVHTFTAKGNLCTFSRGHSLAPQHPQHRFGLVFGGERTFNPLVAGSNPARPTTNKQETHEFTFVGFLLSGPFLVRHLQAKSLKEFSLHVEYTLLIARR
jgi:hypothetical protein